MAGELVRYQECGHLHLITFSCYRRLPYLAHAASRELFERSLESMRIRYDFLVVAYVVMPEHVHLLVSEPRRGVLSKALQALKLSVAVQSEQRPFWQRRYHDFNVFTEKKVVEKRQYIHRNPVTRGLVNRPDAWAWSSFCHWWSGEVGTVEIESPWTVRRRGGLRTRLDPDTGRVQSHISPRCGAPTSKAEQERI